MAVLELVVHPVRLLGRAADRAAPWQGWAAVGLTGLASMALGVASAQLGGGGAGALAISAALPAMLLVFWLGSVVLVSAGARLMGLGPRRTLLATVSGMTYPPLALYGLVGLIQAASPHLGGAAVSTAVGLLALPVVAWFVALNAVAVRVVYGLPPLNATAIALLPYAALSALLLLLVVVLSLLHAAGAV